jgi:periplasmic divalent cation tolerance protein
MSDHEALAALIWCPFPDEAAARAAAATLLDERLIACANMVPGLRSLFAWQGARDEGGECGALLKTTAPLLDAVMRRLAELHPYETPAITGWTVRADAGTLAWLGAETRG